MTNNINHFKEIVDNAWVKHTEDQFRAPTTQDMDILIKTCLMPLALKTQNDSFTIFHELKQEMHADLKYVESLEKEINELESDKAEFSNMYDMIFDLKKLIKKCKGKSMETKFDKPSVVRQPNAQRILKPPVLGVNHKTNVSRPQHRSNQMKDKVVPNNSQVKLKKTQVEDHPRKPSISNKIKSVTACNDGLNSRTSNVNVVCATYEKCLVDSDHFACVTKMLNDVNARTKKPNIVPISTRKPKGHANKSFATPHKKKVASKSTTQNPKSYYRMLYEKSRNITINGFYYAKGLNHNLFSVGQFCDADLEVAFQKSTCFARDLQGNDLLTGNHGSDLYTISLQELTSSTPLCLMAKASPTHAWLWHRRLFHLNFDYINLLSKKDVVIGLPKLKYIKDQLCSSCEVSKAKRSSFKSKAVPSTKGRLNLLHMDLCGPMRVASINRKKYILIKEIRVGYSNQSKGYRVYNKRTRLIIESIYIRFDEIKEMSKTAHVPLQQELDLLFSPLYDEFFTAEEERLQDDEFTNPFYTPVQEVAESSSHIIEQVHGNPSKPVQTRRKLATDPEMCIFALTMSIAEPKNIKEAMANSTWIEAIQEELHQFDRLQGSSFVLTAFSDAEHAGCIDTRKSTSRGIQFLGDKLVSWMSKKQDFTAMSSTKAEYVALSASCAQVIWMRTQLQDSGLNYNKIPLYCDSQSTITISCNPVQHSRTKHIHTRHHFIKEQFENGIIEFYFVKTKYQLADMFTKALPKDWFKYLVRRIEKVYRLRKAHYGLKQAPMAWYDELSKLLTSK
nr:retrovirus-related Pol polyprotein from transposon TNT 1-94 [Tanacetum cinerariifolium]